MKGTVDFGLIYTSGGKGKLTGFSDCSLGSDIDDSGMIFYLNKKNVISWEECSIVIL